MYSKQNNARKRNTTEYATVGNTYTVLINGLGASPQSVTHKPKGKEMGLPFSCRPGRAARLGRVAARWARARTWSSSTITALATNTTGPPRGSTARPVRESEPVRSTPSQNTLEESETNRLRERNWSLPHAQFRTERPLREHAQ